MMLNHHGDSSPFMAPGYVTPLCIPGAFVQFCTKSCACTQVHVKSCFARTHLPVQLAHEFARIRAVRVLTRGAGAMQRHRFSLWRARRAAFALKRARERACARGVTRTLLAALAAQCAARERHARRERCPRICARKNDSRFFEAKRCVRLRIRLMASDRRPLGSAPPWASLASRRLTTGGAARLTS